MNDQDSYHHQDARETASALHRRPIGNAPVASGSWGADFKKHLHGRLTRVMPVYARRDAVDAFDASWSGDDPAGIWNFMQYGPFHELEDMLVRLEHCEKSDDPAYMVFRETGSRKIGGMGSYLSLRPGVGAVEIGHIWFGRDWQRTFFATEALSLMMHQVMDKLAYRRIEWKCNALNLASRRAALRLGFRFEGIFLNHMITKGYSRDTAWYSITDGEWPGVSAAHTRWLAADNFSPQGEQLLSLSTLTSELW